MRIHVLGICGTFMAGIAILARQLGYHVSGSDENVYPPMSTQLERLGIDVQQGYAAASLPHKLDLVVIGNVLSRGNPAVEQVLNSNVEYISGPAFLAQHILRERWVLAVAGTHGKTTGPSILAWILEYAHMKPGFLIGGLPKNFSGSARLGEAPFFVVEADEYDTAFFDKRSKFLHYRPRTLVINNLEYDHADIFDDLAAIKRQFHHLIRCIPSAGKIVVPAGNRNVNDVLKQGCWSPVEYFSVGRQRLGDGQVWRAVNATADSTEFDIVHQGEHVGRVVWSVTGSHNMANALGAIVAARHAGISPRTSIEALSRFQGVSRRMEQRGIVHGITIYDDFAHHPTEVRTTLAALRQRVGDKRIIAVLEPRSNTMRMGVHRASLGPSLSIADIAVLYQPPDISWNLSDVASALAPRAYILDSIPAILKFLKLTLASGDHVVIMSNGAFGNIHERLLGALAVR